MLAESLIAYRHFIVECLYFYSYVDHGLHSLLMQMLERAVEYAYMHISIYTTMQQLLYYI